VSDIDFQNGFIVGMATRGLTVSRKVVEGSPPIVAAGSIKSIFSVSMVGGIALITTRTSPVSEIPSAQPDWQNVEYTKATPSIFVLDMGFSPLSMTGGLSSISVNSGSITII
jgi:hypothetical protein